MSADVTREQQEHAQRACGYNWGCTTHEPGRCNRGPADLIGSIRRRLYFAWKPERMLRTKFECESVLIDDNYKRALKSTPSLASPAISERADRLTARFPARILALPLESDQCAPLPPGHGRPQLSAAAAAGEAPADRGHSGLLPG